MWVEGGAEGDKEGGARGDTPLPAAALRGAMEIIVERVTLEIQVESLTVTLLGLSRPKVEKHKVALSRLR